MNPNQDDKPSGDPGSTGPIQNSPKTYRPDNVISQQTSSQNNVPSAEPQPNIQPNPAPLDTNNQPLAPIPTPSPPPLKPNSPGVVYGSGQFGSVTSPLSTPAPKRSINKKLAIILASVLVVVLGGSAYAYFGYYMSPSTIWSDSLSNASEGYNKLVGYVNAQSKIHYSGLTSSGSFALTDGSKHFSGSDVSQSEGASSTTSVKLDLGTGNIDFEERSIAVPMSSAPDIYLQLSGVNNLGSSTGTYGPILDKINGQWILIDHNLIDDLESQDKSLSPSSKPQLTWAKVESYLVTTESINKKYLFTANKSTSVTTVLKSYGRTTVNGQSTDHYLVGFNKTNLEAYEGALCTAFINSSLGSYVEQETHQTFKDSSSCKDFKNSASKVNASDNFQIWDDVSTRLPYQIRVSDKTNPAVNYVDIGLNYTSGNTYPFFISGQSGSNDIYSVVATLNTSSNSLNLKVNFSGNSTTKETFSGEFNIQPSSKSVSVTAPSGAIPITTELDNLGLGSELNDLTTLGQTTSVTDQTTESL